MRFTNKKIFIFNLKHLSKMLCIGLALAFILSSCSSNTTSVEETSKVLTAEDIYALASPSTVEIIASNSNFSSTGTGFFDDINGTVITNYHVIDGAKEAKIKTYDGKEYKVLQILGYDEKVDIAILSTSCTSSTPLAKNPSPVATGQKVYALGSSLGLTGTFSEGIVSTASRDVDGTKYIQITAPISHGNSGGPLLDENGKVVGITTAGFVGGQNLNLAVPIVEVNKIPRTKKLTLQVFFDQTPAIQRVSDFLESNGEQTYKVDTNVLLTIKQNKRKIISIKLEREGVQGMGTSVYLDMDPQNPNYCSVTYAFDSSFSCLGGINDVHVSRISNSMDAHIVSLDPIGLNGYELTKDDVALVNVCFALDLSELIVSFDKWVTSNQLRCSIKDFGFKIL